MAKLATIFSVLFLVGCSGAEFRSLDTTGDNAGFAGDSGFRDAGTSSMGGSGGEDGLSPEGGTDSGGSGGEDTSGTAGTAGRANTAGMGGTDPGPTPICTPAETNCQGMVLNTCADDGMGWETETCGYVCSEGACQGECSPGDMQCDGLTVETCDANGEWVQTTSCAFLCDAGTCGGECSSGAQQCDGDAPQTCVDGYWETGSECEFICSGGECTGACTPDDTQCNGTVSQTCNEGGTWTNTQTCPYVCSGEGNCTGACVPGSQSCSEDTPRSCNSSGQWVTGSECPFLCSAGSCTGVCEPGTTECNGLTPRTCNGSGQWVNGETCDYVCSGAGNCTGVCSPGARQCSPGGDAQICNSTGQWALSQDCAYTCSAGNCTGECVPGAVECDGAGTRTCQSSGFWGSTTSCPSGGSNQHATCGGGICGLDCDEGWGDCTGANGCETDLETNTLNCGACGHDCSPGACQDYMCTPGTANVRYDSGAVILSNLEVDDSNTPYDVLYFAERNSSNEDYIVENTTSGSTKIHDTAGVIYWVGFNDGEFCWTQTTSYYCEDGMGDPEERITGATLLGGNDVRLPSSGAGRVLWQGSSWTENEGNVSSGVKTAIVNYAVSPFDTNSTIITFVTSTHNYWASYDNTTDDLNSIWRQPVGSGPPVLLVEDEPNISSLWVDGNYLFWTTNRGPFSPVASKVKRMNLSNSSVTTLQQGSSADSDSEVMYRLTGDGTFVYWINSTTTGKAIFRAPISGTGTVQLTPRTLQLYNWNNLTSHFAISETRIYWVNTARGGVYRLEKTHWSDY